MANYNDLKTGIDAVIKTNGRQEISGAALNAQLKNMITELGAGYQYMGVATPATNPGAPDANVFYLASEAGTYTNFGGIVINEGEVCALVWNGTWTKQVTGAATADKLNQLGQYCDKRQYNFIGNTNQVWKLFLISGVRYRFSFSNTWLTSSIRSGAKYFVIAKIKDDVQTNIVLVPIGEQLQDYYEFVAEDADYYFVNALGDSGEKAVIYCTKYDLITEEKTNEIIDDVIKGLNTGKNITWDLIGNENVIKNFSLIPGFTYRIAPNPTSWGLTTIPAVTAYFVINKVKNGATTNIVVVRVGTQVESHYDILAEDADYYYINMRGDSGESVDVNIKILNPVEGYPVQGLNFACFGDSITSDDISGIGTKVNQKLKTNLIGNFAVGGATCANWSYEGVDESPQSVAEYHNAIRPENVLMNQVLRLIQYVTASGQQISWTHPIDGAFTVPITVGTGLGHTSDIPDLIYIAIGINDGQIDSRQGDPWDADGITPTPLVDDFDSVRLQSYSELTKITMASALRWALETLQSKFPNAQIFVASPLHAGYPNAINKESFSDVNTWTKMEIIKKVCDLCSVHYIPSFEDSGYGAIIANQFGLHPTGVWLNSNIPAFIAEQIEGKFIER